MNKCASTKVKRPRESQGTSWSSWVFGCLC